MQISNSNVMVTGGAGFIGSHLVDKLMELDCNIRVYDNLSPFYTGKEDNIRHHMDKPNFKFVNGDILNLGALKASMKNLDVVFHLAAQPGVRYSLENPNKTHEVNVTGTLNVLMAAKANEVKKVIFASSSCIYGAAEKLPMSEESATNPVSLYGVSKLAAEAYCKIFHRLYGTDIVILRYFTAIGARQRPDMSPRIFVENALQEKPIIIFGDGNQSRDFVSVHDIAEGTIRAAETDGISGESFNIGSGRSITINELAKLALQLTEKEAKTEIQYEAPKLGEMRHTLANIQKAKKLLKFTPKRSLKESLEELVTWSRGRLRIS